MTARDALHTPGGVTDAVDARHSQAGLLAVQGPSPLDIRTGVLAGPGSPLAVTGTASMAYAVAAGPAVTLKAASQGPYLPSNDGSVNVVTTPAPASNSRIDVIWIMQRDAASAVSPDGVTQAEIGVTQGAAAAAPVAPAIPVGALELARATVAAGATATNGAGVTITNTARKTVARGGILPVTNVAERDALAQYSGLVVYRIDTGNLEVSNGAGWTVVTVAQPTRGRRTVQTDGAGLFTISHGLGVTPSVATLTPVFQNDTVSGVFKPTIGALSGSTIQVVAYRTDSSARLINTIVSVDWVAWP